MDNTDINDETLNNLPDEYWTTPGEIVTDTEYLSKPTTPVDSIELGEKIAAKLFHTLNKYKSGIALTANQIGISKSVFVVNVIRPMIFINPEIVKVSDDTLLYKEYCLSLPGKRAKVERNFYVRIKALNIPDEILVGITQEDVKSLDRKTLGKKLLEGVAVQHEFNHTQGILITDLDVTLKPVVNEKKFRRNDKIVIRKDTITREIKYKLFDTFKKEGWVIV